MKRCQAKVKKIVPFKVFGTSWGTKEVSEQCPNNAKGLGDYCGEHGCFDCSLQPNENCSEYEGIKLCIIC